LSEVKLSKDISAMLSVSLLLQETSPFICFKCFILFCRDQNYVRDVEEFYLCCIR
jgi:hypothetical protein